MRRMSDSNPFLDALEAIVGKLTPRRLDALSRRPVAYLLGLRRELLQLEELADAVPPKDDQVTGHVRPYFPHGPLTSPYGVDYDPLVCKVYTGVTSEEAFAHYRSRLVRRLLFCHSVAIDDPVTFSLPTGSKVFPYDAEGEWEARRTLSALTFVAGIRPLVTRNLVTPVPRDEQWYSNWWFRARSGSAPDWYGDLIDTFGENGSDGSMLDCDLSVSTSTDRLITDDVKEYVLRTHCESERSPLLSAIDDAVIPVGRFIRHHGRLDFDLPPDPLRSVGLAEVVAQEAAGAGLLGSYARVQDLRVRTLVDVPVPALDDLAVDALLRLREDSEAFTTWRLELAHALDQVAREVDLEAPDSTEASRRIILEHTWPTLNRLATNTIATPGLAQTGMQRLVLGVLPVATGLLLGGPVLGLATAAGSAGVATAWTYAASRRRRLTASAATSILEALRAPEEAS